MTSKQIKQWQKAINKVIRHYLTNLILFRIIDDDWECPFCEIIKSHIKGHCGGCLWLEFEKRQCFGRFSEFIVVNFGVYTMDSMRSYIVSAVRCHPKWIFQSLKRLICWKIKLREVVK